MDILLKIRVLANALWICLLVPGSDITDEVRAVQSRRYEGMGPTIRSDSASLINFFAFFTDTGWYFEDEKEGSVSFDGEFILRCIQSIVVNEEHNECLNLQLHCK